jgi:SAM-dependent methyltransferase
MTPVTVPCPGCGSEAAPRPLLTKGTWQYATCPDCGLVHLDPVPSPGESAALYGESYFTGGGVGEYIDYEADDELHRINARSHLRRLSRVRTGPPGRLLDFGCAHGFVADEIRDAGWDVEGVEIADVAAQHARDRFGLTVYADLEQAVAANGKGAFDVVTFFQVLSQLPDSAAALDAAHALLRPGGMVMVESSNRGSSIARRLGPRWHLIAPPSVISLFDPETLDSLLRRRGFEPAARFPTRKAVSVGLVTNVLEQRYGRVFAPLRAVGARPGLRGRAIRYPFADLMTVVAERR